MTNTKQVNGFESFPIGAKVQSYDKDGYYIMSACGTIEKHLGDGHAIIQTFDGEFCSSVGIMNKVHEIESIGFGSVTLSV